jgi:hypothetical protein
VGNEEEERQHSRRTEVFQRIAVAGGERGRKRSWCRKAWVLTAHK